MGTKTTQLASIKKALVTGGGGFVGKAVVKRLQELGVETRVLGRHRYADLEGIVSQCIVGNICDPDIVKEASRGVDVVFHVAALAGIWGPWKDFYSTNVLGTEVVIDSCRKNDVPALVYTSTPSVVFNREDIRGANEDLPYANNFLCNYAKSKVMAEKKVLGANNDSLLCCALRPHLIWGPGDPHLLPRLLTSGRKKELKRIGDGSNLVDISYIDNVAEAHILAAKNLSELGTAAGNAYFISQGEPVRLWDWIDELFVAMEVGTVDSSISFPVAYGLGATLEVIHRFAQLRKEPRMTRFVAEQLARSHYFSIDKAHKDLGYEPIVTIAEGLQRTVQWLKECWQIQV